MESITYERCQVPSCPLTGGWENINHAVKPGCIRCNQAFNNDLSSNDNTSLVSTMKFVKRKQQHCCDCHGQSGTSTSRQGCSCKQKGLKCTTCYPLSKGNCFNADLLVSTVSCEHEQTQDQICPDLTPSNESAQILTEINDESLAKFC